MSDELDKYVLVQLRVRSSLRDYWYEQAKKLGHSTFSSYLRSLLIRELGDNQYRQGNAIRRLEHGSEDNEQ